MIQVNGREMPWEEGMNIKALLKACNFIFPQIVVKVNGEVVLRKEFQSHLVPDEAEVEVIHLIGGG